VAANHQGIRRLHQLYGRYGVEKVQLFAAERLTYTEARARQALRALPDGVYEAEDWLDDDGRSDRPIRLRVKVTIDHGRVAFDFTGSDRQRPSPMNATFTQSHAACTYVLRCLIDQDIPTNDGFFRLVDVVAPPGTVTNARAPVGVVGGWEVSLRLCDVLFQALAPGLPRRVPAGCKAMVCHASFGGLDPRSGEYYCFLETVAGGHGGRWQSDGPDAVQTHHQNTQNAPVEEVEVGYPILTLHYGLRPDSEGPGTYRGGLGVRRDYTFRAHEPTFTVLADRRTFPPRGLFGGRDGQTARYSLVGADGTVRDLPSKVTFTVPAGGIVRYETCGGGGYGDPFERDPQLVLQDVLDEKLSLQRASREYGVVIDAETLTVDGAATRARRGRRAPQPVAEPRAAEPDR
jgi:N-methylhydantoinase B